MTEYDSIGLMIKKYIRCRNRSISETADAMGFKVNTFSAQLINNTVTAKTLFRLAAYLDIDLNWMMEACGYHGPVSAFDRETIPRMRDDFRENEKKFVLSRLDALIKENPTSTPAVRRELINEFHENIFYLLDVLVPYEYELVTVNERGKAKYYVDVHQEIRGRQLSVNRRKPISCLRDGNQALDIVIEERKDKG